MKRTQLISTLLLIHFALFLSGCGLMTAAPSSESRLRGDKVAETYGAADFDRIQALRYTFNVKLKDRHIQRHWVWSPGPELVTFNGMLPGGERKQVSYNRRNFDFTEGSTTKKIDRWFINDKYWLLFPLHLSWDQNITLRLSEQRPLPVPPGRADRLTVAYPSQGGYTPGDVYELFLGPENLVVQWVYRKGGAKEPTRTTTWEDHARLGPIVVSLSHQNADGTFQLWFSDVAVKVAGDDSWRKPIRIR